MLYYQCCRALTLALARLFCKQRFSVPIFRQLGQTRIPNQRCKNISHTGTPARTDNKW